MKLNFTDSKTATTASPEVKQRILKGNYSVGMVLKGEVIQMEGDYRITGGSAIDGIPMCKYVDVTAKRVKVYNKKRHRHTTVSSKFVNHTTAVLNLVRHEQAT